MANEMHLFPPEAYSTAGNKLWEGISRRVVFKGVLEHGTADTLWATVRNQEAADVFCKYGESDIEPERDPAYTPEQMGVTQRPGALYPAQM